MRKGHYRRRKDYITELKSLLDKDYRERYETMIDIFNENLRELFIKIKTEYFSGCFDFIECSFDSIEYEDMSDKLLSFYKDKDNDKRLMKLFLDIKDEVIGLKRDELLKEYHNLSDILLSLKKKYLAVIKINNIALLTTKEGTDDYKVLKGDIAYRKKLIEKIDNLLR